MLSLLESEIVDWAWRSCEKLMVVLEGVDPVEDSGFSYFFKIQGVRSLMVMI